MMQTRPNTCRTSSLGRAPVDALASPTRLLIAFVVVAIAAAPASAKVNLQDEQRLAAILKRVLTPPAGSKAVLSAHVVDLANGRTIFESNADQALMPASVMKMIVGAAALDRLGPEFKYETRLGVTARDLVVIGSGDPTIGDEKLCAARGQKITAVFNAWADALLKRNIAHIPGRLIVDDSIFESAFTHASWPRDQYQDWYEAPIGGLNFADNCVEVSVTPRADAAQPALSLIPANTYMSLINKAQMSGRTRLVARRAFETPEIIVSGGCTKAERLGPIAVVDPGLFFAASLRTVLAARGIRIDGPIERLRIVNADRQLPKEFRVIATHRAPLVDALKRAGQDSLGMMAEGILKTIGAASGGTGSWPTGRAAVIAFVRRLGVSDNGFSIDDGSGLSRENRVSARAATVVLAYMHRHAAAETFRDCLALSGSRGTLLKRLRTPDVKNRIYAKTGYINSVRTLAGYIRTADDRWLAFAFFYNNSASTAPLSAAQDKACRILARLPDIDDTPADSQPARRGKGGTR